MAKNRRDARCAVALDGQHRWRTPEARHDLPPMFSECGACGAISWVPKGVIVSIPQPDRTPPQPDGVSPQPDGVSPQHIIGGVEAKPVEQDDLDASNS
jgi:hypothetical protein